ncbi:hypothetical protein [Candidatus Nitrosocosmicus arcticus]|uniref:Uncharacterized protein n=1 Tax=Candidatus Nitrosocosmicus arcticus TaxID=2035267 RepID=A0A557SXQ5_9ARCH|nr:hypothetical protein [Candidatus Nitrosocosmicus arcticus]TVP41390.1 hypothetical protein NARC_30104 [Candidatus Nitrosocosmicus arcticus]
MDDSAFRQLKESQYYHPILTEVMFDHDMMLEMVVHSMTIVKKGYDTVWDSNMINFNSRYFTDGIAFVEKLVREKGIKLRLIVEVTKENIDFINSIRSHEIRCLSDINGNFGIFDNRAYMVYIFHTKSDRPDQTLWSNSKALVDKQQSIFNKLWEMAIPLAIRRKEIEYEDKTNTQRTITEYDNILSEIESLVLTCKKELIFFSSNRILCSTLNMSKFMNYFPLLIKKHVMIKILTDNVDEYLIKEITEFNKSNPANAIQFGYTDKLGDLDEMTIISDNKYLLHIQSGHDNKLIATFSNEGHNVLVQQIMFEKHWNEVMSLEVIKNN